MRNHPKSRLRNKIKKCFSRFPNLYSLSQSGIFENQTEIGAGYFKTPFWAQQNRI